VIHTFLNERLQAKLDKLKEGQDAERQKLLADYQPERWIADAAKKADKVQLASHAIKYIHPDAVGSSLNSLGNPQSDEYLIGTHTLGDQQNLDVVVSTAAYLPIYKFLSLSVDGQTLLQRCIAQDPALSVAFSNNPEIAQNWMAAFANLAQPKGKPASHTLAKQIYWPLDDGQYHLLSPLFPTSLAHTLWNRIRENRFSDETNAARKAQRESKPHPSGYHDYPNLVIQKFGGTKPQNISQLNSERHGENYLLDARPPVFHSQECRPLWGVVSLFDGPFERFGSVRSKVSRLKRHLRKVQWREHGNMEIGIERERLLAEICDDLLNFAAELQLKLPSGWTQHPDCRLKLAERYWLDPTRAASDADFAAQRNRGDWRQDIAKSFGVWLNSRLDTQKMHFDQYAAAHWAKAVEQELKLLRLEVDND
jgi:CRISPR-associated protein Csy1